MFTLLPEFADQYYEHVELGKNFAASQNISIVGLVRNLETSLKDNINYINQLAYFFKNVNYFIYENDSVDSTVSILENLSHEIPNFYYKSESLGLKSFTHKEPKNLKSQERTTNLANHRNICLNYVNKNFINNDFVIVMDMDFYQFSIDGIMNSFGWLSKNCADALMGNSFEYKYTIVSPQNQILWNYDCWAYRGSWWDDLQKYSDAYKFDPMMWFGFWQPPIGSQPIRVNSAFGGIGIYKNTDYISAKYEGYDCEHVCFHKNLYNKNPNYRLCINPSQIMIF